MYKDGSRGNILLMVSLVAALASGLGCSKQGKGDSAADQRAAAKTPEEIEALFRREKDLPEARPAKAPDGAWRPNFQQVTG